MSDIKPEWVEAAARALDVHSVVVDDSGPGETGWRCSCTARSGRLVSIESAADGAREHRAEVALAAVVPLIQAEHEAETDEYDELLHRQSDLLDGVAEAIKGKPPILVSWNHHDLPEQVQALIAERDSLRAQVAEYERQIAAVQALANVHRDRCCVTGCVGPGNCASGWRKGESKCDEVCNCESEPYLAALDAPDDHLRAVERAAAAKERERIAEAIEAKYLGPDAFRSHDGREGAQQRLADAYDEGLHEAARIARADQIEGGNDE